MTQAVTSEVTLGSILNRISTLIANKQYRPSIPLAAVLTPEEIHALSHPDRGDG